MQTYEVRLESPVSESFRCVLAANSLDIDTKKKSIHELKITCDLKSPFNVGLIVGASGSGKTTLAKQIFGEECFKTFLQDDKPIIDQLPKGLSYDNCAAILSGVGLTSVPCWIRPAYTLSNGQKARAEAALAMTSENDFVAIDEWTSVVDRTVAKVMSHCVQKFARKNNKKIILNSCHYDVIEWLDPDWIIDCNKQEFIDRRLLHQDERRRTEKLIFTIKPVDKSTWNYFSKYHYLSNKLPGGKIFTYGLFHGENQIGFQCFANYIPIRKGSIPIFHSNRVVIHPDYAGFGLGIKMVNSCADYLVKTFGYEIRATFSSKAMLRARLKDTKNWRAIKMEKKIGKHKNPGDDIGMRSTGFRENVRLYTFQYIGTQVGPNARLTRYL